VCPEQKTDQTRIDIRRLGPIIDHKSHLDPRPLQSRRTPRDRILATLDYLERWFENETFHGCPFISAAAEFGDETSAVFREAAAHKRLVVAYLEELTNAGLFAEPKRLAQEINLLIEGATAVAHVPATPAGSRRPRL
jgi:hypothetical protein